ncbi:hypothetical protein KPSA3_01257 [Pseudomonas syringae pv. actinidiae]|uniref:Uncharacterized protein n=1 Tax=Pseudomonas syringae pv. actinidiae TaxID=103796 RepID=A0AAN4Q1H9_PSESF|nr:hypothetical protein KPSA3_01257 [Pseudomonas syringae pv. actinidiae]
MFTIKTKLLVIRMPGQNCPGAIHLLADQNAHQRMRQCQRRQRPALLTAGTDLRCQPFGTAYHQVDRTRIKAPAIEFDRQLLSAPRFALHFQRDNPLARLHFGQHRFAFLTDKARDIGVLATGIERDFHQFKRKLGRHPFGVFMPTFFHPLGHARTHSDQTQTHIKALFVAWCMVRSAGGAAQFGTLPQTLQVIELACRSGHHVNDHIAQVQQNPVTVALAFFAQGFQAGSLDLVTNVIDQCVQLAIGSTGADQHVISDAGLFTHVDGQNVGTLDLFQGCDGNLHDFFTAHFLLCHIKLIQLVCVGPPKRLSIKAISGRPISVRRTVKPVHIDIGQYRVWHQKTYRLTAGQQLTDLGGRHR